jgi:hypothetical protein
MIVELVLVFAVYASALDASPGAAAPSGEARAIDRVLSDTPAIDGKDSTNAMTEKLISACLQAHDNDATLCRVRTTVETGNDVPRQRVEDEKRRLDPTPDVPH